MTLLYNVIKERGKDLNKNKKEIKKMTNLVTKEVKKFIESKKESYSNMTEKKLVSEIEEASKELEADDTLEDLIENTLYYNSAMDEIIMRIAEK